MNDTTVRPFHVRTGESEDPAHLFVGEEGGKETNEEIMWKEVGSAGVQCIPLGLSFSTHDMPIWENRKIVDIMKTRWIVAYNQ